MSDGKYWKEVWKNKDCRITNSVVTWKLLLPSSKVVAVTKLKMQWIDMGMWGMDVEIVSVD